MKSNLKPQTLADKLGVVRAKLAELTEEEAALKQALISTGLPTIEGRLFHVSVVCAEVRQLDTRGLLEELDPPDKLLNEYTTVVERTQVRCRAR